MLLSGEAIAYRFSNIEADSVSAQIVNAPAPGIDPRDDGGLLTGTCLEGNLCIGSINAPNSIALGGANSVFIDSGADLASDSITISARDLIDVGTDAQIRAGESGLLINSQGLIGLGSGSLLTATGAIAVATGDLQLNSGARILGSTISVLASPTATALGEIRLGDQALISGANVSVFADLGFNGVFDEEGSFGTGSIAASGRVGIGTNGSLTLGSLTSFDPFDTIDSSNSVIETDVLVVPGSVSIGTVSVSNGNNAIRASSISVDSADAGGEIQFDASNDIFVGNGFASAIALNAGGPISAGGLFGASGVTATGSEIGFSQIEAQFGPVSLDALSGSIVGGGISASDAISLTADAAVDVGDLSGLGVSATAGTSIDTGNIISGIDGISLSGDGAIITGDLTATLGSISLTNGDAAITTGIITVGNDFTIDTGSDLDFAGVTAGDDIRITTSGNALLGRLIANASGSDNDVNGSNIVLTIGGSLFVDHAESANNFVVQASRFETGLNSVITEGDIAISTIEDAILGNSTAGGLISVSASGAISFATLSSGRSTGLFGNSISGGNATAGEGFSAFATNDIALGTISSGPSLNVFSSRGPLSIASGTSTGNIFVGGSGFGSVTAGTLLADGDVFVSSGGDAAIGSATARGIFGFETGGEGGGQTFTTDGNVFVQANGAARLDTANARSMIAVSGTSVLGSGNWTAGEDVLAMSSGGIAIGSVTAGDDLEVSASGGNIVTASLTALGNARDDRAISTSEGFSVQSGTPLNGSGIDVVATGSNFDVTTADLAAAESVRIVSTNALDTGSLLASNGDISLNAVSGITTGDITALLGDIGIVNAAGTIATGVISAGNDFTLETGSDLDLGGVTAGDDIRITTSAAAIFGRLIATGLGADNDGDDSNIVLNIGGNAFVDHAESANDFLATANRFETGPDTIITDGDIVIGTPGDALLGNSRAGGFIDVSAGGVIGFDSLTAGLFTNLSGNAIAGGNVQSGDSFSAFATNDITLGTVSSGPSLSIFTQEGNVQIASGASTGSIFIGGEGLGNVTAGTLLADGDVFVSSGGNATIDSATARGSFRSILRSRPKVRSSLSQMAPQRSTRHRHAR